MDALKFTGTIVMLSETFGRPLLDGGLEGYRLALRDLTDDQLARAVGRALRESKFMPSPSELRDLAGAGTKANALVAWDAVRAAMRKYGYTTSVDLGPLVNAVVRNMGGWRRLDDMATAELDVWGKKEFERVYALLATQDPERLNGAPLAGAFGGEPVRIAISGQMPQRQIEAAAAGPSPARALAEAKALR